MQTLGMRCNFATSRVFQPKAETEILRDGMGRFRRFWRTGSRGTDEYAILLVLWNASMSERPVLVGLIPQAVVLDPGDQVSWISDAGNLRVEFDVNRCPFSSNIFQAPAGMRLLSGPPRVGVKAGTFKYRLWLNEQIVGQGEVILRDK
jgi:hypothetical protein